MRRRIGGAYTGLGGGGKEIMDNKETKNKKLNATITQAAKEVYEIFFKGTKLDDGYCDAQYREYEVTLGIEPSYMYENLKIIVIARELKHSYVETGYAWGPWGTGIRKTRKWYQDMKYNGKYKTFITKWHEIIYGNKKQI